MAKLSSKAWWGDQDKPILDWQARERSRFDPACFSPYEPVPWASEPWAFKYANEHFPHLSKQHVGLIAYTPNAEKGLADAQVPIRPGRYLKKYYPDMTTEVMSKWSNLCFTDRFPLVITKDPKVIRLVYRGSGMSACMSHAIDHYMTGGLHPTELYASSPDLAVAYIHDPDMTERPLARAIIWPDKKLFSRIYGNHDLMTGVFLRSGWKPGVLDGARLGATHMQPGTAIIQSSPVVCPFIDHLKWARLHQEASEMWWIILQVRATGATHSVQHTNGIAHPIGSASRRPYGVGDPQRDWLDCIAAEGTPIPDHFPNGNPTHAHRAAISTAPRRPYSFTPPRTTDERTLVRDMGIGEMAEADWIRGRDMLLRNHAIPLASGGWVTQQPEPIPTPPRDQWEYRSVSTHIPDTTPTPPSPNELAEIMRRRQEMYEASINPQDPRYQTERPAR